ncbi:hypothetical protein AUC71_12545 [Methyloceanibacter marginalis]|uniref:Uncharacterized protein n=1 Tax=Methyloceanibacter marginalis TaxID=1774971 RepID=A0A1E3WAV3_9HYPH|nr:hypothetical protein AUC71_12545 [Methyloceanibacter marginalis]
MLASGTTWHGRGAARYLFAMHGLDADRHLAETLPSGDPGPEFRVSLDRLEQAIGRKPQKDISWIAGEMIAAMSVAA